MKNNTEVAVSAALMRNRCEPPFGSAGRGGFAHDKLHE